MDPYGDYFIGNYNYTGFFAIKTKSQLEEMKVDTEELMNKPFAQGAIDQKERMQRMQ